MNGRNCGDPWSLRQIGVYEKLNFETRSSKWILLQPSSVALQSLEDGLRSRKHDLDCVTNSMSLHTILLFTSSRQWPDYIDHLRAQVESLVRIWSLPCLILSSQLVQETKACRSAVGRPRKVDYRVEFQHCQELQGLRRRLIRASDAINSSIKITEGYQARCLDLVESRSLLEDVENHRRELQGHRESIQTILKYSKGTARLV